MDLKNTYRGLLFLALSFGAIAAEKPNIIVVLVDDMGYSDIGSYGGEVQTPNLDSLAEQGIKFNKFYNTGRCSPSRASLLTGLYSQQAGVGRLVADEGPENPGYRGFLSEKSVTLAEVLAPAGYNCFVTGKWHVGSRKEAHRPLSRGFHHFYGMPEAGGVYFEVKEKRTVWRDEVMLYDMENQPPEGWYSTDIFTDEGLNWVRESVKKKKPFLWYVPYCAPHYPLHAKPADIAKYKGRFDAGWDELREQRLVRMKRLGLIDESTELSPRFSKTPAWDTLSDADQAEQAMYMEVHAAMIDCVDQNIGRIIQELKKMGQYDNTLIVFLSDNGGCSQGGPMGCNKDGGVLGSKGSSGMFGEAWANLANTPFRLFKKNSHEGGVLTPFIAHWPKGITAPAGTLIEDRGHIIDLMPTLIEVAGATYPERVKGNEITPMQGVSLVPAFSANALERDEPLFFEHEWNRGIIDGSWKLVKTHNKDWELFAINDDPTELNDLASKMPERVQAMAAMWSDWAEKSQVNRVGNVDRKGKKINGGSGRKKDNKKSKKKKNK